MRVLVLSVLLALASASFGQATQGTYKSKNSQATWQINSHSTLLWDGTPYIPIGLDVDGDPKDIATAKTAGFTDVLVDLPVSDDRWQPALDALASANLHYLIRINSLTPMAHGIAVDPASYRVSDLTTKKDLNIAIPDAAEALVVIADKRDGSIISFSKLPVTNGFLKFQADPGPAESAVVLIYPQTVSLEQPDYWEGLDDYRDQLLSSLKRHAPGPGLRGIVNPLGQNLSLPGKDLRFIPTSPAFKEEFAAFLDARYRNVVSALQAWSLRSDIVSATEVGESKDAYHTFAELTSLVPLWSGSRGVAYLWDTNRNQVYSCEKANSAIWKDYADAISDAETRRFLRIVSAIKDLANVPVIQEWADWAPPYETPQPTVDGIGMKAVGSSPNLILATAARSASSMLRWPTPGWLTATRIDLDTADAAPQVGGVLDDLFSLGARGVFVKTQNADVIKALSAEAARRRSDVSLATYSLQAIFYPENASNPAVTQRLPGGKWWLPCPADGNRIDYGDGYFGYRMDDRTGPKVVIWTNKPGRVLLHMKEGLKAAFQSCDGTPVLPKASKEGVEIDLGENPVVITGIDEIPVPDPAFQAASATIAALMADAKDKHISFQEEQMAITDAYKGFDRNPGGSFLEVRQLVHQIASEIGDFSWIEAERAIDNNFSEVLDTPACSGEAALALHASIDTDDAYYADYGFEVHSQTDQQVWLAAKIPPEQRPYVNIRLGSQTFPVSGEPIGLYANGYGWYKLGVTRLIQQDAKLRITVTGPSPDLAIDAIAITPLNFRPDGVEQPTPTVVVKPQVGRTRPGGRGQKTGG
jgi:hypothetical protein